MKALLAALLLLAPAAAPAQGDLNVVLVTVNSLQAGRLSPYGGPAGLTPNAARLAERGFVFERAVAQSNWTLPSLVSLFTSRIPRGHGVYERGQTLAEGVPTLAGTLKGAGWRTAAFTGGLDASGASGLSRGFDVYDDDTGGRPTGTLADTVPKAEAWLAANKGSRFFLYVQGYDAHPPYDKPWPGAPPAYSGPLKDKTLDLQLLRSLGPDLPAADLAYIRARYDAGVAHADRWLGRLLDKLDETGLSSSTVVILTAEHGEELGEHGTFDRFGTNSFYDETLVVPLIVRHPGYKGGSRIRGQVRLMEIMPTLLDLLGINAPKEIGWPSFLPALAHDWAVYPAPAVAEAGPSAAALLVPGWKLIREGDRYRLYDLMNDPGETADVSAEHRETTYELAKVLAGRFRRAGGIAPRDVRRIELSPEMRRKLREAGYWR